MALTLPFLNAHIAAWEQHFGATQVYPYRVQWPSKLFHHAPIENALTILRDGALKSRNDPTNTHPRDIAGDGVIDNRPDAHTAVRLYFRPKTPTQFHIEGIRKADECQFGHQAPILVMFVLQSQPILTTAGVRFSDRNMQSNYAAVGSDNQFFGTIPFDKVFHEGSTGTDNSIKQHRCAEVLCPSPLQIAPVIDRIYCRSDPEKATLIHLLDINGPAWQGLIHVSLDLAVFQKNYVFVNYVGLTANGVVFELNPRSSRRAVDMHLIVRRFNGDQVAYFHYPALDEQPPSGGRWRAPVDLAPGAYLVRIELEGHLAFEAPLTLGDVLF